MFNLDPMMFKLLPVPANVQQILDHYGDIASVCSEANVHDSQLVSDYVCNALNYQQALIVKHEQGQAAMEHMLQLLDRVMH